VSLNNNIDNYWNIIKSFSPERLVNNWYWLILDINKKYLTKKQINKLKKWDSFLIRVYDKFIKVVVDN
jgi:hypothetical protein